MSSLLRWLFLPRTARKSMIWRLSAFFFQSASKHHSSEGCRERLPCEAWFPSKHHLATTERKPRLACTTANTCLRDGLQPRVNALTKGQSRNPVVPVSSRIDGSLLYPLAHLDGTKSIYNLSPQAIRNKFTMATMSLSETLSAKADKSVNYLLPWLLFPLV